MKKEKRKAISIDFDGVLASYSGWKGEKVHGKPMPGLRNFLKLLDKSEIDFYVFTIRKDKKAIVRWFEKYKLPMPLKVSNKKLKTAAYIDDRAINFNGDFKKLARDLKNFKVYWRKGKVFPSL